MSQKYYSMISIKHEPYTCGICRQRVTYDNYEAGWRCPNCSAEYELYLEEGNNPQQWSKLTGGRFNKPEYGEWYRMRVVEERLKRAEITAQKAREETEWLAKIIMEHYQPWLFGNQNPVPTKKETLDILDTINIDEVAKG